MSHTTYTYPMSTGGLMLAGDDPSCVREEEGEYRPFYRTFMEYIDLVNEKLPQVRAIISLMEAEEHNTPDGTLKQASLVIGEFIDDIALASKGLEAEYYREKRRNREK
jgi:hypothetical protein